MRPSGPGYHTSMVRRVVSEEMYIHIPTIRHLATPQYPKTPVGSLMRFERGLYSSVEARCDFKALALDAWISASGFAEFRYLNSRMIADMQKMSNSQPENLNASMSGFDSLPETALHPAQSTMKREPLSSEQAQVQWQHHVKYAKLH